MKYSEGCMLCSEELIYLQEYSAKQCAYCGSGHESNVECPQGHFVCDDCHRSSAFDLIEKYCSQSQSDDPMMMAVHLMKNPVVKMHGPEHHFLVPAVLVSAYYNHKNEQETKIRKLNLARKRAETVPGGYCGTHGSCGAAIGAGIFVSIITSSTPLSKEEWSMGNRITGEALVEIAKHGGPRCCKRDSFLVISKVLENLNDTMGVGLPLTDVICEFSHRNIQCRFDDCLYYPS